MQLIKHNFYLKVLTPSQRKDINQAASVDGIDDEIILLRLTLRSMLAEEPKNMPEILHTTAMLAKLIKVRHSLSASYPKGLEEASAFMEQEYCLPLGISKLPKNP
jgi:hypothetical protein